MCASLPLIVMQRTRARELFAGEELEQGRTVGLPAGAAAAFVQSDRRDAV
jgi:hypothetical protein